MKNLNWLNLSHRFLVTTGYIALIAVMAMADNEKMKIGNNFQNSMAPTYILTDQWVRKSWLEDLFYISNSKKNLQRPELDKVETNNSLENK